MTAGQLAAQIYDETDNQAVSKWDVLRDATTARKSLGVSDRDLAVLQALLSFHPDKELGQGGPIVVFPSNKTLSERAHGMAESTLRRHLSALVKSGLILRHDSPNGKRYARRGQGGVIALAFGFDLSPLVHRATELAKRAEEVRQQAAELAERRERCVLMIRDAGKLIAYSKTTDEMLLEALRAAQRHIRRQSTLEGLTELQSACERLLGALAALVETDNPSGNDSQNERHQQSPNTDTLDSDLAERAKLAKPNRSTPLPTVLAVCPEFQSFSTDPIRDWRSFIRHAGILRNMIAISDDAWNEACRVMGVCEAAIVTAVLLERLYEIKSPGGYLRALTKKAEQGVFCAEAMVAQLLRKQDRIAA